MKGQSDSDQVNSVGVPTNSPTGNQFLKATNFPRTDELLLSG